MNQSQSGLPMIAITVAVGVLCLSTTIFLVSSGRTSSKLGESDMKLRRRVLALEPQVKGMPLEKALPIAQKAFPELKVRPLALSADGSYTDAGRDGPISTVTLAYHTNDPAKKVVSAELA